jgi:hypothetical protein
MLRKRKTTIKKEKKNKLSRQRRKKTYINIHSYTEKHPVQKMTHILTSTSSKKEKQRNKSKKE